VLVFDLVTVGLTVLVPTTLTELVVEAVPVFEVVIDCVLVVEPVWLEDLLGVEEPTADIVDVFEEVTVPVAVLVIIDVFVIRDVNDPEGDPDEVFEGCRDRVNVVDDVVVFEEEMDPV